MLRCRGLQAHALPRRDRHAPACGHGGVVSNRRARGVAAGAVAQAGKSSPLDGFADYVLCAQTRLCAQFEELDDAAFADDPWTREDGSGRGSTRVLTGSTWEKAACNVSVLSGVLSPQRAVTMSQRGRPGVDPKGGQAYSAVALSLVFHALSPMLPTFRADIRAFAVEGCDPFYGGGADLTPAYVFDDDAKDWHAFWAGICDEHQPAHAPPHALYRAYKEACDEYFYLPARKEHRGIGGLFFDDVPPTAAAAALTPVDGEAFARAVCENWVPAYAPIVARRRGMAYGERERQWQLQRRGRYLEFNLLYDRGVRFGLDTGRIESIMVSAPPLVRCVPGVGDHTWPSRSHSVGCGPVQVGLQRHASAWEPRGEDGAGAALSLRLARAMTWQCKRCLARAVSHCPSRLGALATPHHASWYGAVSVGSLATARRTTRRENSDAGPFPGGAGAVPPVRVCLLGGVHPPRAGLAQCAPSPQRLRQRRGTPHSRSLLLPCRCVTRFPGQQAVCGSHAVCSMRVPGGAAALSRLESARGRLTRLVDNSCSRPLTRHHML